jgi:GNAT superfamily N-acetyltransferase
MTNAEYIVLIVLNCCLQISMRGEGMIFRMADENDSEMLAVLRWDFKTEGKEYESDADKQKFVRECTDFLRPELKNGNWYCWVAEDGGNIVSQTFIRKIRKLPKPGKVIAEYGSVSTVYTRPSHRAKGIGSELMKHVKQWASENKLEYLVLWPSRRAVPFYEREGFTQKNEAMELQLEGKV